MRAGDETVVLASFGTGHPSTLAGHLVRSLNDLTRTGADVLFLNLGAGAPPLEGLSEGVAVSAPGFLRADDVARKLAAVDVFLAPLADGVSTRRTTVMAALQHGVAVVGTDGPLTDPCLRRPDAPLRLLPVDRPDLFSRAVSGLAASREQRVELGAASRALYRRAFDWPVLTAGLLEGVGLQ